MPKAIFNALCVFVLLFFCSVNVNCAIMISDRIAGEGVYIAGNDDFYPIEYYDKKSKAYKGILPDIMSMISERTGIDFIYLHKKNEMQTDTAKMPGISIVSAYMTGAEESYVTDEIQVLMYETHGKMIKVGIAFTQYADDELKRILKNELAEISQGEINSYIIKSTAKSANGAESIIAILIVLCLICIIAVVLAMRKIRIMKGQIKLGKMIDEETGIGNLMYFDSCFSNIVLENKTRDYMLAYIIIDNNFLKAYKKDTTFSVTAKYVAEVLENSLLENDFAARITESGFVLAFKRENEEEAMRYIEGVLYRLNMYTDIPGINKTVFHTSVYKLSEKDFNSEILIFNLRQICNKIVGTNEQIIICDERDMNRAIEEKKLGEELEAGFKKKEFKLFLQFVVDNVSKEIVSCEALSRWKRDGEIIPPGKYIGLMEEIGLISELDYYMFEMVCRQLHKWKDTELGDITISCNITRITLSDPGFLDRIKETTSRYVFDKSKLIMEITEESEEEDVRIALHNVKECKRMGFKIALDDMGSGYTCLSNLCDYPIDIVKVDRNILLRTNTESGRDLLEGMVALAHSLGKKVVCEGVETTDQNSYVSGTSCDYIQGYYYSGVFPEEESRELYRAYYRNGRI